VKKNTDKSIEIKAKVLDRLISHLDNNKDVQNIDLMILAGFCRNCLSNWYKQESEKLDVPISKDQARELIYRMPYAEWKKKFQTEASPEQMAKFNARKK